jgi:hypothetical protein
MKKGPSLRTTQGGTLKRSLGVFSRRAPMRIVSSITAKLSFDGATLGLMLLAVLLAYGVGFGSGGLVCGVWT